MNQNQTHYMLDANVLMTAHRDYYAPDICPGFWECIGHYIAAGQLLVIDRVWDEIIYPQELVDWLNQTVGGALVPTTAEPVIRAYGEMMNWVQGNHQFLPAARDEFARVADGWLAAYAMANNTIVVTNEVSNPNVRRKVQLPNLCEQFGVGCINTYDMIRELGLRLVWERPH